MQYSESIKGVIYFGYILSGTNLQEMQLTVVVVGKYIKGRWVRRDYRKYPQSAGYPPEDEVEPTLSWRLAEAWKVLRGKPTLQERILAAAPEMYALLYKCSAVLEGELKSEVDFVLNTIKSPQGSKY